MQGDTFNSLYFFGSDFVSWIFIKNFLILEVKIRLIWAHWVLGGAKDENSIFFLSYLMPMRIKKINFPEFGLGMLISSELEVDEKSMWMNSMLIIHVIVFQARVVWSYPDNFSSNGLKVNVSYYYIINVSICQSFDYGEM